MCHPFACSTPSRATPLTTRALQRVVDAERWRVERLEREQHGLSEREQMDLGASTESMPSSAAFEDSAISSEGEEGLWTQRSRRRIRAAAVTPR